MQIPTLSFKVLYPPAEPAVPNAFYLVRATEDDPVEIYVTDQDGYLVTTGNTELIQTLIAAWLLNSPALGGHPSTPDLALDGANLGQAVNKKFVYDVRDAVLGAAPEQLNTLVEIASALNNNENIANTLTALIAAKANAFVGPVLLSSTAVNLNEGTLAKQALYTVPASRRCIVTRVDLDKLSGAPSTVEITMGWNAPATDTLDALRVADLIGGTTSFGSLLVQPTSWLVGTAAQVLGLAVSTPEGSALTGRMNIFGYLTDTNGVPIAGV